MKKKDIVLKKGDKVYYTENGENEYIIVNTCEGSTIKEFEEDGSKITKIERPVKYETIYEAPKEILDKEEKEYLEAVLRPFKEKVEFIQKRIACTNVEMQFIAIDLIDETVRLPNFDKDTMYKGMELWKQYTLEELGLFEGE